MYVVLLTARKQALELSGGPWGHAVSMGRKIHIHQVPAILWENGEYLNDVYIVYI